mgnify:CR=1 FL=1
MDPELCQVDNKIFFYCSVCDKVLTRKMSSWKNHINSRIHAKAKDRLTRRRHRQKKLTPTPTPLWCQYINQDAQEDHHRTTQG